MNKKILALSAAAGAVAVCAAAVHGYLNIMGSEKIPDGIIKRIADKTNDISFDELGEYTKNNAQWVHSQAIENIDLKTTHNYTVKGYLLMAERPSKVFVVFAHGYRSSHDGDPINFQRFYYEQGFNFLSFDHTAAGESEGNYVGFDYFESQDTEEWIDYLVSRFGDDIKIILHGVSMGGATVCQMASTVPEQVKFIVSDCAYTGALDEFDSVIKGVGIKHTGGILRAFNAMNRALAGFDLELTDVRDSVKNSKVPMLFVHGSKDDFVPTKMGYELYDLCNAPKDLFIADGAEHAQSIMIDKEGYENKLSQFIEKYI